MRATRHRTRRLAGLTRQRINCDDRERAAPILRLGAMMDRTEQLESALRANYALIAEAQAEMLSLERD